MGLFDGVHRGHSAVIRYAVDIANKAPGVEPAVFTFETDTVTSKGKNGVRYLLSSEVKREMIEAMGVKYIYSPDFMDFRDLSAEEFVDTVLQKKLKAEYVICGEDFRFGKGASGNADMLKRLCDKRGIKVCIVPPVADEKMGQKISSTMIRELIEEGKIQEANELLGYSYCMKLPVAYGHQIGRTLDFPTINQYLDKNQVIPKFGVYASEAEFDGKIYKGVTNIGIKPTVANTDVPLAETYIIGFEGDLYGEMVKVSLIKFIRPERKFDGLDELKRQIAYDVKLATE